MPEYLGKRGKRHVYRVAEQELERIDLLGQRVRAKKHPNSTAKMDDRPTTIRDMEGFTAEFVVSEHYGDRAEWKDEAFFGPDAGYDILLDGRVRVGVKASRYRNPCLFVKVSEMGKCHAYIQCYVNLERRLVELVGWLLSRDVRVDPTTGKKRESQKVYPDSPPSYRIQALELNEHH